MDVYHKEQLLTKEEAEKIVSDEWKWVDIAGTKDSATATRIADILDMYGFDRDVQSIRGECVYKYCIILNVVYCIHASFVLSVCVYIDHYTVGLKDFAWRNFHY